MKKKAYIICCNDDMKLVCLTEDGIQDKLEKLAKEHYNLLVSHGQLKQFRSQEAIFFKEYGQQFYWHIHDVELTG